MFMCSPGVFSQVLGAMYSVAGVMLAPTNLQRFCHVFSKDLYFLERILFLIFIICSLPFSPHHIVAALTKTFLVLALGTLRSGISACSFSVACLAPHVVFSIYFQHTIQLWFLILGYNPHLLIHQHVKRAAWMLQVAASFWLAKVSSFGFHGCS